MREGFKMNERIRGMKNLIRYNEDMREMSEDILRMIFEKGERGHKSSSYFLRTIFQYYYYFYH